MVVQHNMQAMNANRMLNVTTSAQAKSTEKLSSGYRINRAADDAAGLSISEKMRKQIKGLNRASSNAQDGISAVQTAEGALTEVHSMLQRMNELATQASNGTNSDTDRQAIQDEMDQLTTEIDRVAETTKFNETYLLKGDGSTKKSTVNAHDAGLAGKLTDNGDGTTTFKLDKALAVGDTVSIAGKDYTIGKSKDTADYIKAADVATSFVPTAVGDSVTKNGATQTIVAKATKTGVTGIATLDTAFKKTDGVASSGLASGDTITTKDGKVWTWTEVDSDTAPTKAQGGTNKYAWMSDDATPQFKKAVDYGDLLQDGAQIKTASTQADLAKLNGATIVNALDKTEVSVIDATAIGAMKTGLSAGDSVTVGGVTKEVTDATPTSFEDIKATIKGLASGTTVKIGFDSYTLGTKTDDNTITADDFLAKVKEGDTVNDGTTSYTAIGVSSTEDDSITVNEAYKKMEQELTKASSIGTDTAATVKSNGDGSFKITNGTVETKGALSFSLHVGADADMTNKINVDIETMNSANLGIKGININDETGAAATYAIDAIADAISKVSSQRSTLGAVQNRLEHTINNLDNVAENTTSAESSIRDTDMATEMVNYSKNNILAQAGQSMLAQANQSNQGVLSLLG
ncbi:MAG: flagellin [bacterium]|nr:flagellin [bacterium]